MRSTPIGRLLLVSAMTFATVACQSQDATTRHSAATGSDSSGKDKMNPSATFIARQRALGKKPNRLIDEKSPYLIQHAFNPVDWYPWGEEAFTRARADNKPIFLSVGYSTCHWCHVMAHESFENPEIAALMNQYFINIKVDREERPDVDRVYMTAVQALTGQGGWPMSVFLTPDLRPFYGGTYFPPQSAYGRPGFVDVLQRLHEAWETQHEKVVESAGRITQLLQNQQHTDNDSITIASALLDSVYEAFRKSYDAQYGGFGAAPKFPRPSVFNFLFHYYKSTDRNPARDMALFTLAQMREGGIYDHLGGGFHRYAVDPYWRVPHFEKMLYDQAQLVNSYLDAYQISGESHFAEVAREILEYVERDLCSPKGGFYSAEDADSAPDSLDPDHKIEGAFYMWTWQELVEILGESDAEIFAFVYGIAPVGNTLSDPHGEFGNRNVLYAAYPAANAAKRFGKSAAEIERIIGNDKSLLFAHQRQRPRPLLDDKIITAWNGLMISAFARAGAILEDTSYLDTATGAADFVLHSLLDPKTGTLWRRFRDDESRFAGNLDDYAFLSNGLLDLYEAGADIRYFMAAETLVAKMTEVFSDQEKGGFFETPQGASDLLFRSKEFYDGAEPAANSMAILALLRLGNALDRKDFLHTAERAVTASLSWLQQSPSAVPQLAAVIDFALHKPMQIVIAGDPSASETKRLLREVNRRYLPNRVMLFADGQAGQGWLEDRVPFVAGMAPIAGKPAVYVCENFVCELPTTEVEKLAAVLRETEN